MSLFYAPFAQFMVIYTNIAKQQRGNILLLFRTSNTTFITINHL